MKKITMKLIPTLFLILFFAAFASASMTVTNPTLTGYIEDNITGTVTITNTGTDTIENLIVSTSGFGGYDFAETEGLAADTLASGQSTTYKFSIYIPVTDAESLDPKNIGTITFSGDNSTDQVESTSTVRLDVKSRLVINKVHIEVDGDGEKVSEGERIEAKRGDSISLEIELENNFPSSSNIDFENVEITVYNDNLDIDEDDEIDIDSGDEETVTLNFEIDDDADEGREEIEIKASVEDDEGTYHEYIFTFDLDIDVPSKEILISDVYFSPSIVSCDKDSTLYINLKNTGSRDLDEAMVIVESDEDIIPTQYVKGLKLDKEDSYTKTMRIELPEDTPIGNYLFYVTSYYGASTSDDSDEEIVNLEVVKCVEESTTPIDDDDDDDEDTSNVDEIIVQTQGTINLPTGAVFATPKEKSKFDLGLDDNSMIILLLVNLVVLAAVIMVIIAMNKR